MTINLKDNERLDELQRNGYQIIQNPEKFCFGMDAVLLSGFAKAKKGDVVLDMGTGTGIIPILMEAKTEAAHLTGLEIQEESADMARRSVALNGLSEKWDSLDKNTQRYLATIMAGNRQQSRFIALVDNWERLDEVANSAQDSEDAGLIQYAKTLDSLESKLNNLSTSF